MRDVIDLRVTAAEYRELPEGGPRYQLIDGELHRMSPSPTSRHQGVIGHIAVRLYSYCDGGRNGTMRFAPLDVFLSEYDVVQPDLVFLSVARTSCLKPHGVVGAPDLVIEILSPSTRRLDLKDKLQLYARSGVREALYVDLDLDEITVYRFEEGAVASKRTLARGDVYESDVLPGFRATVAELIGPEGR